METLIQNLPQHEIAPVLIVSIVMLTGILIVATTVISFHWRKVRERQLNTSLAKDMLERGMSSDEICDVMNSAGVKSRAVARQYNRPARPAAEYREYGVAHA